jgi:hypothetical protein
MTAHHPLSTLHVAANKYTHTHTPSSSCARHLVSSLPSPPYPQLPGLPHTCQDISTDPMLYREVGTHAFDFCVLPVCLLSPQLTRACFPVICLSVRSSSSSPQRHSVHDDCGGILFSQGATQLTELVWLWLREPRMTRIRDW